MQRNKNPPGLQLSNDAFLKWESVPPAFSKSIYFIRWKIFHILDISFITTDLWIKNQELGPRVTLISRIFIFLILVLSIFKEFYDLSD